MLSAPYRIRQARREDLGALQTVEREAAKLFAEVGLGAATLGDATTLADFAECHAAGLLWVAVDGHDAPVGFAYVEIIGGQPHLDELDVHPDHGRRGIGTALVRTLIEWAGSRGYASVTLTTFRDVPWNMPFYARLGFREQDDTALTAGVRKVVDSETRRGLPPDLRVVMRRDLG